MKRDIGNLSWSKFTFKRKQMKCFVISQLWISYFYFNDKFTNRAAYIMEHCIFMLSAVLDLSPNESYRKKAFKKAKQKRSPLSIQSIYNWVHHVIEETEKKCKKVRPCAVDFGKEVQEHGCNNHANERRNSQTDCLGGLHVTFHLPSHRKKRIQTSFMSAYRMPD